MLPADRIRGAGQGPRAANSEGESDPRSHTAVGALPVFKGSLSYDE